MRYAIDDIQNENVQLREDNERLRAEVERLKTIALEQWSQKSIIADQRISTLESALKVTQEQDAPQVAVCNKLIEIAHYFLRNYDSEIHDGTMSELVAELRELEAKGG